MSFEDRVAVVTGGASGIGLALCEELARRGATVVLSDIRIAAAQEAAERLAASGGRVSAVHADVTQPADVRRLVDDTVSRHGRLDLMFNNAGIGVGGEIRDLALEHWRTAVDINLLGVIYGVVAAYPVMVRQGGGHIVNIASLSGLIASPGLAPYSTTKHAVVGLTRALRVEAETYGVKASVVCPGFIDTAIFDNAIGVRVDKQSLLKRLGLPLMPAPEAARAILRGVERNRGVIVFPWSARALWLLTRFAPWMLVPLHRRMTAGMRSLSPNRETLEAR